MDNLKIPIEIAELIYREFTGEITDKEKKQLSVWINEKMTNKELYEKILNEENISQKLLLYKKYNGDKAWKKFKKGLNISTKGKIRVLRLIPYAAAVVLIVSVSAFWFLNRNLSDEPENEIIAGTGKAILTLSSGEQLQLDDNVDEKVISDKKIKIISAKKILKYFSKPDSAKANKQIEYNTLTTPVGGEFSLELADGSRIWLNADSKLTYPVDFIDSIRNVKIEGEAYFEVAHDQTKPFIVIVNGMEITVLGTSFNVTAYKDETIYKTTLVEGKVRISLEDDASETLQTVDLIPNRQAVYNILNNEIIVQEVDALMYASWKDGMLMFDNESLESIMRKLSRWYNIKSVYISDEVKDYHFSGTLNKYEDITEILNMISLTTNVDFSITGNTIKVNTKK